MITWIQQTFQQHFRVIFAVLLAVVIISFVFTIGAAPGVGGAQRGALARPFFGLNLTSEQDQRKLFGDAQLSVFLQTGMGDIDQSQLERYALTRHAGLAVADQLGVPAPTDEEKKQHIQEMPRFASDTGQFDPRKYSEFRDSLKKGESRVTEGDISRVLSDDIRFERMQALLGGPGYVLPAEVKKEIATTDTLWTVTTAAVDYASYTPNIQPTEAALTAFFDANTFRYELPPQVVLSYVEFPASAHVDQISVTEADVRAYYDANPTRFPKPGAAAAPAAVPNAATDFPLVRNQVENALKLERAQRLAASAASDFAVLLFERKITAQSPELAKLVADRGLTLRDAPAFSAGAQPPALGANPQISEEAFRLNKNRSVSDAVQTDTGSVVLFWRETIPSRTPALTEVRARVSADYVEEEKRRRFTELGRLLRTQVAARVSGGEAFEKAIETVAAANNVKVVTKTHPAFSIRQRPQDVDFAVFNALQNLNKGEVSEFVRSQGNQGLLVYAADKKLPDLSDSNPALAETRARISQFTASRNANEYLQEMVSRELAKSAPAAN